MPAYTYEALDADGRTERGVLEADTARAARSQLRARTLVPLAVEPVQSGEPADAGGAARRGWQRPAMGPTALAVWTRQLAGLVGAGLPLERALAALAEESASPAQARLVAALRAEVNAGAPFARALGQHPQQFDEVYRGVVAAGEQGGALATVLERLASDLEERLALRARLIGAALYPAIVSAIALAIVVFLMTWVVPQVAGVFAGGKRSLPALTAGMLALSGFIRQWGGWLAIAIVFIALTVHFMRGRDTFRLRTDALVLTWPLLGRLVRGYNAARFAGTLAMLAAAGVPILRALQTAADTLGNRAMRADALDALVLVREGAPLASALAQHRRFPPLLAMFARLGEQTGTLPAMLDRAARQLAADVQQRATRLATLLEPLLVVLMGVVVLVIVLAVLLPIIQLNTFAR